MKIKHRCIGQKVIVKANATDQMSNLVGKQGHIVVLGITDSVVYVKFQHLTYPVVAIISELKRVKRVKS